MATIQPYGAFVNLGSDLNGLLHISQISHDRISSVEQVLEVGQKLKVRIPLSCAGTESDMLSAFLRKRPLPPENTVWSGTPVLSGGFFFMTA